jgi:RNA polymerase sigma factor (sigma-70 family)
MFIVFVFWFYTIVVYMVQSKPNKFITKPQWKYFQTKIIQSDTTQSMRDKINYILFERHKPLLYSMVNDFTRFHKHKCKYVNKDDIIQYGAMSLHHAIRNYNGQSSFHQYAKLYIKGGMYNAITIHHPITKIPKKQRRTSKHSNQTNFDVLLPSFDNKNEYLGKNTQYLESPLGYKYFNNYESQRLKVWRKINKLSPFTKRVLYQKFDIDFNVKYSNKYLADLNSCSEETIRKHVNGAIMNITVSSI